MTTDPARQPIGIPTGGQYAATAHQEALLALGGSADPERDTIRNLLGLSARTGLGQDSITYIGALMAGSPEPVYEENAATLAASYAVSAETIKEIDHVVNHGEVHLAVGPGVHESDSYLLAAAGIDGRLEAYHGDLEDLNDVNEDDNPITYTSLSGKTLILSGVSDGEFTVSYQDPYDEGNSFSVLGGEATSPADKGEMIKDALWDLAVADAHYDLDVGLHNGDLYELRETSIDRDKDGNVTATISVQNEDTGDWNHLVHDYATGVTTVQRDGKTLDPVAGGIELAAVFEDMRSEPADGDFEAHTRKVFGKLLEASAAKTDAPAWARAADLANRPAKAPVVTDTAGYRDRWWNLKNSTETAGQSFGVNGITKKAELSCNTKDYLAWVQVSPDGTLSRFVNNRPVASFPGSYRKALEMEQWAAAHRDELAAISEATQNGFR
ncbi:MAG TPA: hypothetical protein VF867_04255 [Arthrobacter sp.]